MSTNVTGRLQLRWIRPQATAGKAGSSGINPDGSISTATERWQQHHRNNAHAHTLKMLVQLLFLRAIRQAHSTSKRPHDRTNTAADETRQNPAAVWGLALGPVTGPLMGAECHSVLHA